MKTFQNLESNFTVAQLELITSHYQVKKEYLQEEEGSWEMKLHFLHTKEHADARVKKSELRFFFSLVIFWSFEKELGQILV